MRYKFSGGIADGKEFVTSGERVWRVMIPRDQQLPLPNRIYQEYLLTPYTDEEGKQELIYTLREEK